MNPAWSSEWTIGAALANHLWQSTLCVAAAAVLARALRRQAASLRYRVWLLASLKFLVPFSLLAGIGRYLPAPSLQSTPAPIVSVAVHVIGEPFSMNRGDTRARAEALIVGARPIWPSPNETDARAPRLMWLVLAIWASGSGVLGLFRTIRWRRLAAVAWAAPSLHTGREAESLERARKMLRCADRVDLRSSSSLFEPGVIGTIRPMILWPSALTARLTDAELDAVLVHELSHIRRRDNLAAAAHALLETVFWFHPVMWWLEAKLVDERERACDEDVLRSGSEPQTYAGSILKVCDFCLQSPMAWVAGVTGSNLTDRVEEIMTKRPARSLRGWQKTLLAIAAITFVAAPVGLGAMARTTAATPDESVPSAAPVRTGAVEPPAGVQPVAIVKPAAQATTGRVTGLVTDQAGGLLVGATVTIAGAQRTSVTDANGRYTMANLTPGQYEMTVQLTGFRVSKTPVRIDAGTEITHDVQLGIGAVTETLNVTGSGGRAGRVPDEAQLRAQIDNNPNSASGYFDLAKLYYTQGRLAEAERVMTLAIDVIRAESVAAPTRVRPVQPSPPPGTVRVGGDIKEPKKIWDVRPVYPPDALAAGVQGMVILEATIATDGTVKDVGILRSVPALDQAAADAVRQWRFTPTTLNGNPVDVLMTVTVNFMR